MGLSLWSEPIHLIHLDMNARSEEFDVNSRQRMSANEKRRALDLPSSRTYIARRNAHCPKVGPRLLDGTPSAQA
jgi:hypothetical protein